MLLAGPPACLILAHLLRPVEAARAQSFQVQTVGKPKKLEAATSVN
jgi:hypothetical protein